MKTFSLVLSIILFSAVFSAGAYAQSGGSVSGKVLDTDGKGVKGAQVTLTLKGNASVTFTAVAGTAGGADGAYHFENLPAGEYIVTATDGTSSGKVRANENVTVAAGEKATLDLTLLPVVTAEVTIASGTAQSVDQVSKSVSTLTSQDIENRDEQKLADALRTVPGIRVQQSGGFGRLTTIKTRGLRNHDKATFDLGGG